MPSRILPARALTTQVLQAAHTNGRRRPTQEDQGASPRPTKNEAANDRRKTKKRVGEFRLIKLKRRLPFLSLVRVPVAAFSLSPLAL
jgi:hypothetical protein